MENSTAKSVLALDAFEAFDNSLNRLKSQASAIGKERGKRNADKLKTMAMSLQLLKSAIHNIHLVTEISVQCANDMDSATLLYKTISQRKAGFEVRTDWESQVDELIKDVQLMMEAAK